jgi:hypothetical protein
VGFTTQVRDSSRNMLLRVNGATTVALFTAPAEARVDIENEHASFKSWVPGQFWASGIQDGSRGDPGYKQELCLLRAHRLAGGKIARDAAFSRDRRPPSRASNRDPGFRIRHSGFIAEWQPGRSVQAGKSLVARFQAVAARLPADDGDGKTK